MPISTLVHFSIIKYKVAKEPIPSNNLVSCVVAGAKERLMFSSSFYRSLPLASPIDKTVLYGPPNDCRDPS